MGGGFAWRPAALPFSASPLNIQNGEIMDFSAIAQASPYFQGTTPVIQPACILTPNVYFPDAAKQWLTSRSVQGTSGPHRGRYIRENTRRSYEHYLRSLELFFAGYRLGDIHLGDLEKYQGARLQGSAPFIRFRRPQDAKDRKVDGQLVPALGKTPCPVKPKKINQELSLLMRVMKRANCWTHDLEENYQVLLDDEEEIPRAFTQEQQRVWLDISRKRDRWNVVHWYSILAFETCMSTDEIRGLRLGDINLAQRIITVARKTAKNVHRQRTIEIVSADALWAIDCLMAVARNLGASQPLHYLFPWRVHIGVYDPTRGMSESGIKLAWSEVRAASGLTWFRQYDCRHTAITRLAEAGVPTDVIMARAGHVSEKMRRHYTHISQASQRQWLEHSQRFHHVTPATSGIDRSYVPPSQYAPLQLHA
jgi:integrase